MAPRKRGRDEMEASEPPKEMSLLERIRNMWEFASTMQYIFMFGKVVKIDEDFDIEDFETECLKPAYSEKLEEIGINLLKSVSSQRALNYDNWDEYTRRQYVAKAPQINPYGEDEEPRKFRNFDIFQKIRVLHQLTVWTFWNADRIRDRMPDHQKETEQLEWRIEPVGYDRNDRNYYLLDDNRLYRRTEPSIPPPPKAKPKSNSIKAQAARRRENKRRRIIDSETPEITGNEEDSISLADIDDSPSKIGSNSNAGGSEDTFGGFKWGLVAITLTQYQEFCESLRKSKDVNEKELRSSILENVIPIIEAAEEKQRRKIERRERELITMEKMATAKRSSRLADRHDRERQEREAAEAERKHAHDLAEAHREQERQEKMDEERQSRMMTREQRIKDREFKRILAEEELARAAEDAKKLEAGEARGSERQLKEKLERKKKELEDLSAEEEWTFDCSGCGVHGKNLDDGSHSVACEKCSVWQHSKCLGISKPAAEKDNFHFVCKDCIRREEEAKKPKISLKFRAGISSSPPEQTSQSPARQQVEVPKKRGPGQPPNQSSVMNGPPRAQGSLPTLQKPGVSNGYLKYTVGVPPASQYAPYPNGHSPQHHPQSSSGVQSSPQPQSPNGYAPRPGSSSGQQFVPSPYQYPPAPNNNYPPPPGQYGQYPPYYNGRPHQYQGCPPSVQPPPLQATHSFTSSGANTNAPSAPNIGRIPSPVVNRPTMSPTQGNYYDVRALTGDPQRSPVNYPQGQFTPSHQSTARRPQQQSNGLNVQSTPTPLSNIPNQNQLSGISPTKHSPTPPLPLPSNIPQKMSISPPPPHASISTARSVSGTPIFPPAEKLAPSPQQLSKNPAPTPRKHSMTGPGEMAERMGEQELKRVSEEVKARAEVPVGSPNAEA